MKNSNIIMQCFYDMNKLWHFIIPQYSILLIGPLYLIRHSCVWFSLFNLLKIKCSPAILLISGSTANKTSSSAMTSAIFSGLLNPVGRSAVTSAQNSHLRSVPAGECSSGMRNCEISSGVRNNYVDVCWYWYVNSLCLWLICKPHGTKLMNISMA